jgi:hypothetical protein
MERVGAARNGSGPVVQGGQGEGIGMKHRNGLLFPLMVLAAGSVSAFGCIGIAAITGYLPLARGGINPLDGYSAAPMAIMERTTAAQRQRDPVAVVAADSGSSNTKAVQFEAGKAVGVRKPTLN